MSDVGQLVTFVAKAVNGGGNDTETWQVLVKAKGDLFFKLIKESGHILDTVTLNGFFKQAWGPGGCGGSDGSAGTNLADVARRLGIR